MCSVYRETTRVLANYQMSYIVASGSGSNSNGNTTILHSVPGEASTLPEPDSNVSKKMKTDPFHWCRGLNDQVTM